jgi:peptidoglycan/LPS O-acetylase OafA/YrhL
VIFYAIGLVVTYIAVLIDAGRKLSMARAFGDSLGETIYAVFALTPYTLPSFLAYLLALSALPQAWSPVRRRLAAIALSPVAIALTWLAFVDATTWSFRAALIEGALVAGMIVRLRRAPPLRDVEQQHEHTHDD